MLKTKNSDSRFELLNGAASFVAPRLLGCILERKINGQILRAKIVETEAYDQYDMASHSYHGITGRTKTMFGHPGFLYVYFTYGMHHCCNVVVGPEGQGSAVLIRAVEPIDGESIMVENRGRKTGKEITNGPAKFCQAFVIDKTLNNHDLCKWPLRLVVKDSLSDSQIVTTTRIGISQAQEKPWRFYIKANPYVSKL
ncbi:MAG: DNA-3-methyladenine glycosylase [bacterium]|nr:DNA-3-methyladenine glycosylase [bacterium]